MEASQYRLDIRFDDELLDAGFTAIPNLLLQHYRDLGLSDGQAFWIVHLLRFKWSKAAPHPRQGNIPMACSETTRHRYAQALREKGLLFTRRLYHTHKTAPRPGLVGKIRTQAYYFDALFHNLIRIAKLDTSDDFIIELPAKVVRKTATGFYHDVPDAIKSACEKHIMDGSDGPLLLNTDPTKADPSKTGTGTDPTKADPSKTGASTDPTKADPSKTGRQKEDSYNKEETSKTEKEEVSKKETASTPTATSLSKQLLSEFGINDPALTNLSDKEPHVVRGWLLYLDTQDFEGKQGYLVKRLRSDQPPPSPFLKLGMLTQEQIDAIEQAARDRQWTSQWNLDTLDSVGVSEDVAEMWYKTVLG